MGMKVIITAGGTSEPIDKVRKITNMSKGTLGQHLASAADNHDSIETVYYISAQEPSYGIKTQWVRPQCMKDGVIQYDSTQAVHDTLEHLLTTEKISMVIHAMAVSDYTVDHMFTLEDMAKALAEFVEDRLDQPYIDEKSFIHWFKEGRFRLDNSSKVSSKSSDLYIKLSPTDKIISKIKEWSPDTLLVGFKLLENVSTEQLLKVGRGIQEKNDCEFVFANDIKKIREQGGHQGYLIFPDGGELELNGLEEISQSILGHTIAYRRKHEK